MNICGSVPRWQPRLSHNHGAARFKVYLFLFSFLEDPRIIFKALFDGGNFIGLEMYSVMKAG